MKFSFFSALSYTKSKHYRADIDGLRTIAVFWVLLGHVFPQPFGGGFVGVDVFFVISGFLITSILLKGFSHHSFSFVDFYAKRIRRIFPPVIFAIVLALVAGFFLFSPEEYKNLGASGFYSSVFFQNIRLARGVGYFDVSMEQNVFMHFWSLAVEEQFYLCFPLLLWGLWKLKHPVKWVGAVLGALCVSSLWAELYYQSYDLAKAYFLSWCRFWQLGVGSGLAYLWFLSETPSSWAFKVRAGLERYGSILSTVSLITLCVLLFSYGDVKHDYPGWWAWVPTLCAVFVISAGANAWPNQWLLARKPMVYLGWLSFPIYIWHWVLLAFAENLYAGAVPLMVKWGVVAATMVLAMISFHCVELPIRRLKANRKLLCVGLVAMLIVASLCGLVSKTDGLAMRLSSDQQALRQLSHNHREVPATHACPKPHRFVCWSQTGQEDGDVLLLGDSHTGHLIGTFAKYAPNGIKVDIYEASGTQPLMDVIEGFGSKELARGQKIHDILMAAQKSSAKWIVISAFWSLRDPQEAVLLKDGTRSTYDAAFTKTMNAFLRAGKKVALLIDTPHMSESMESCLGMRMVNMVSPKCAITRADYDRQVKVQRDYLYQWAQKYPNQVFVIESGQTFCDEHKCWMKTSDGRPLYSDDNHLSDIGGEQLSRNIWKLLKNHLKSDSRLDQN